VVIDCHAHLEEIAGLLKACPKARLLLTNGIGFAKSALGSRKASLPSNHCIEISRLSAVLDNETGHLLAQCRRIARAYAIILPPVLQTRCITYCQ